MFVGFGVFICLDIHTYYIERILENSKRFSARPGGRTTQRSEFFKYFTLKERTLLGRVKCHLEENFVLLFHIVRTARTD